MAHPLGQNTRQPYNIALAGDPLRLFILVLTTRMVAYILFLFVYCVGPAKTASRYPADTPNHPIIPISCDAQYVGFSVLPPTSYLLPPTSYLLPPTSYLRPPTSYLLPPISYLSPPTSYLLPPTSSRLPPTSYLLPPPTPYLLPPTSYLLPPISYLPPPTSYLLPPISYLLPPTSYLPPLTFYLLPPTSVWRSLDLNPVEWGGSTPTSSNLNEGLM